MIVISHFKLYSALPPPKMAHLYTKHIGSGEMLFLKRFMIFTGQQYNARYLHLKTISPQNCVCPHCGGCHVIKYGIVKRILHNFPFGSKPCYLSLQTQRYCCKDCGSVWQSEIPFTRGEVSYTYRFSRYVLDLLRMGNTIKKDVSRHFRVGWNMVKDYYCLVNFVFLAHAYTC